MSEVRTRVVNTPEGPVEYFSFTDITPTGLAPPEWLTKLLQESASKRERVAAQNVGMPVILPPQLQGNYRMNSTDLRPAVLVGITGLIGSGKSSLGEILMNRGDFFQASFADSLKHVCAEAFGWNRRMLEGDTPESRAWREKVDPKWGLTPRSALQKVGVAFRMMNPDHWVERTMQDVDSHLQSGRSIVITDCRFPNEARAIQERGGIVVRVERSTYKPTWWEAAVDLNQKLEEGKAVTGAVENFERAYNVHVSEWAMAGYPVDTTVHNADAEDWKDRLTEQARILLHQADRARLQLPGGRG